ncbi:TIGR01459 family HAD-type hydrolase [Mesorhizobium sp. M4B.F.Ca.ET.190.01.1.1]|uniref:TIGR01459 family HAD-type hydrolase n=1 Tax=unclassified Mesorhizobium TaxID=325217 RepID=UPI000FE5CD69|nr:MULTISPECIES: TIGR01459 family HAD-type hydrolase [unclassified Mesorhizobium]RWA59621.1 MAG: TIGR01459 family HAD-type hydrolase [Mesorhizobium sp.]RWF39841.1 MAG: TIGR01459 family HAD-type hydrolase [Mesorhizobium sp.]RWF61451.1 MAG: TIGR01459 family HAD-type hydrolase [Mesorhizobium sp.]TGR09166.1 TIGR01459 family HAD-type hydrolase [Mesorhizobium sp. M4B.F.Ca.ET.200.01.1.1]TGS18645.1 TIGR01459 family HAD-type hydrolase [Mesorhizobium sp. M4B.F.Ca.ET.190.01.1.1]
MSAKQARHLDGVAALAECYSVFLLDQFGVLHDGQQPYPGAVETLSALKRAGKTVTLISNSGKRAAPNERRLLKLGFEAGSWDHFVSSGEVAWRAFHDMAASGALKAGTKCLLISRDDDRSAIDGLPLALTDNGSDAELVLISASEGDRHDLEHYRTLLGPAAARRVPCFCTNPDRIMLTAVGPRFGAGELADLYESLGGNVTRIGKPYPAIYEAALALAGNPDRGSVVCVGDSVEHDIAGGAGAGVATALVRSGILADVDDLSVLFDREGAYPDYTLDAFRWR